MENGIPARDGDLLNLRDLEQRLVQMKCVSNQDADIGRQLRHTCHRHLSLRRTPYGRCLSREPCTIEPTRNDL